MSTSPSFDSTLLEPDNNVITQIVNYGTPIPDLNNVDDEEVNELRAGDLAVYNVRIFELPLRPLLSSL